MRRAVHGSFGVRDKERGNGGFFRPATVGEATKVNLEYVSSQEEYAKLFFYGEFDSGSERTLAACLRHASRTGSFW